MELSQLAEGLLRIDRDGNEYLGIVTYIPTNTFAVTKLTTQQKDNGYIVRDEEIEEWRPRGFTEYSGRLLLYGPFVEGKTLSEVLKDRSAAVLSYLSRLTRAMRTLRDQRGILPYMHTRGIVFLEDGGVLFLPRNVMQSIRDYQSTSDRIEFRELFRHPDLKEEETPRFALAVAAYRAVTEEFPYQADSEEDLRERMRSSHLERPRHLRPEIREKLSNALFAALKNPAEKLPELEDWEDLFGQWIAEGVYEDITEEERVEIKARAEAERQSLDRSFRRQEYFRRNWKRLVAISLVAILVGTIPATIIYNQLQPSPTAGMEPAEVVRAFYTGISNLDHETMEGATVDGVGDRLIREVTGVFVYARMRLAVEMSEAFADPQQWRDEGMPELPAGRSVYGIANLVIQAQRSPNPEEEVFRVEYEKWSPSPGESTGPEQAPETGNSAGMSGPETEPQGSRITERVFLRQERGNWVIYRIDREREETLPGPDR